MSEERALAERAARAIRNANHRLLVVGSILVAAGGLIMAWPGLRVAGGGGDPAGPVGWIAAGVISAIFAAVGVSLIRAAFGRFGSEGHTQTWFVVVTAIPFVGALIRWNLLRSEREVVDPGAG